MLVLKHFVTIDDLHADLLRQHRRTCQFVPLECSVRQRIAQLKLVRRRRGCCAGRSSRARQQRPTVIETGVGKIPVVFTVRQPQTVHNCALVLYRVRRDVRRPVRQTV